MAQRYTKNPNSQRKPQKNAIPSKSRYNTIPQVPSIQDYLKDSLGKINMADIGKKAKLPPTSFACLPMRGWWREAACDQAGRDQRLRG